MIRLIAFVMLTLLGLAGLGDFCQKQTKGFRLQDTFPKGPSTAPSFPLSPKQQQEISAILDQPFTFLRKGQQCFAFVSQDGKYILKLLRWNKLYPPYWARFFPTQIACYLAKKEHDFASYSIASCHLREETGLLYLSLGKGAPFSAPLTLYDAIGVKHRICLADTSFLLQKKVDPFFPYFLEKIANHQEQELYPFFAKLALLLKNRALQAIEDSDITIEHNLGILKDSPILFDIGNLKKGTKNPKEQASLVLHSLNQYSKNLAQFLEKELD